MDKIASPKKSPLRFLLLGQSIFWVLLFSLLCGIAGLLLIDILPPLQASISLLVCALFFGVKMSLHRSLSLLILTALPCRDRTAEIPALAERAIRRAKAQLAIELGKDVPAFDAIFALHLPDWRWRTSIRVLRNHDITSSYAEDRRASLCKAEILRALSEHLSRPELAKASYLLAMEEITIPDPILTSHDLLWAHAQHTSGK